MVRKKGGEASLKKEEGVTQVESEEHYVTTNDTNDTEFPTEAPGAVVCGNTLTNNNASMFVNIQQFKNGETVSDRGQKIPLPTDVAPVNAGKNVYYFCTINYNCQGASLTDSDDLPCPSPEMVQPRKRARLEDVQGIDADKGDKSS